MFNRRKFLELFKTAILPFAVRPLLGQLNQAHFPIGLQLSTLVKKNIAEPDLVQVLSQIHSVGFQQVEPWHAAYFIPARQLKKDITHNGLTGPSGHFEYADLAQDLPSQLRYAGELGLTWVVCPMLPKAQWASASGFRIAARQFNEWARHVRDSGMRFAFHNHDYEFRSFDGTTGFDILLNASMNLPMFEPILKLSQVEHPVKFAQRPLQASQPSIK
jgi:hypothetical protein